MKIIKPFLIGMIGLLLIASPGAAGDYDWMRDFNIKAEADPAGFRARIEARFQIGAAKIKAVLGSVDRPADAYMLLRLGEMSDQPIDRVIERYKAEKGKGWGVIARSLGIKPGSKEFHALKQGQDLYDNNKAGKDKAKTKGKGRK